MILSRVKLLTEQFKHIYDQAVQNLIHWIIWLVLSSTDTNSDIYDLGQKNIWKAILWEHIADFHM